MWKYVKINDTNTHSSSSRDLPHHHHHHHRCWWPWCPGQTPAWCCQCSIMVWAPSLMVPVARMVPALSEADFTMVWESTSTSSSCTTQSHTTSAKTNADVNWRTNTQHRWIISQSSHHPPPALSAAPVVSCPSSPWPLWSAPVGWYTGLALVINGCCRIDIVYQMFTITTWMETGKNESPK